MKAVIVVEFDVDETGFNEAAAPLMEALRASAPANPTRVSACVDEAAARVMAALEGQV